MPDPSALERARQRLTGGRAWNAAASRRPGSAVVRQAECRFAGDPAQVSAARRFVAELLGGSSAPADDVVLVTSELVSNAVLHSATRRPGGKFTVRAEVRPRRYVRVEVEDEGDPWIRDGKDDERMHGLGIVSSVARAWGRDGSPAAGWIVWARLDWPGA